jgi:hypothetical protein
MAQAHRLAVEWLGEGAADRCHQLTLQDWENAV